MTSYFYNPFRSSSTSKPSPPVDDAPVESLPEIEATPLSKFQQQTEHLFSQSDQTIDPEDPWRSLSSSHRSLVLLRFLRYHLLDIPNATEHFLRVINWRKNKKPWNFPTSTMDGGPSGCPIIFIKGHGRHDEMILYVAASMYDKSLVDHNVQQDAMITMFEHCAYAADGRLASAGILLLDLGDMMLKNVDLTAMRNGINLFFEYYPEVFSRIILINYPRWTHSSKFIVINILVTCLIFFFFFVLTNFFCMYYKQLIV